jgi:hypothetical protein
METHARIVIAVAMGTQVVRVTIQTTATPVLVTMVQALDRGVTQVTVVSFVHATHLVTASQSVRATRPATVTQRVLVTPRVMGILAPTVTLAAMGM